MSLSPSFAARAFPAGLIACVLGAGLYFDRSESFAVARAQPVVEDGAPLSTEAREVAQWAVATRDHQGQPFLVVDKSNARIHAFDAQGRLRISGPITSPGGDTVPAIPAQFWGECIASLPAEPGFAYVVRSPHE